ncbi:hypothetical protein WJX72_006795 [[Myrmecia] bisecta]|uniref:Exonuclease domain-containing protein n=1 Tax=[Myrmecia] bisecta TaxID=41462 RepID=A0AAW1QAS0_9CHLO
MDLLALDVEYAHFQRADGSLLIKPAEVCVVDQHGQAVYRSFCHPGVKLSNGFKFRGGVQEADWLEAPPLQVVAADVRKCIAGKVLVGHGLNKDLAALRLSHPKRLQRDTITYPPFRGPGGQAKRLRELAVELLQREIQSGRHDAGEDAIAAMDLYLKYIHNAPEYMGYQDMVSHYLQQYLQPHQTATANGFRAVVDKR